MTPYPSATAEMWQIEILARPRRVRRVAKRWMPVYCYKDETHAIRAFRMIMAMDEKDLIAADKFFAEVDVEDVRLIKPNKNATYAAARKRRRKDPGAPPARMPRRTYTRLVLPRSGALDGRMPHAITVGRGQWRIAMSGMSHARVVGRRRNQ